MHFIVFFANMCFKMVRQLELKVNSSNKMCLNPHFSLVPGRWRSSLLRDLQVQVEEFEVQTRGGEHYCKRKLKRKKRKEVSVLKSTPGFHSNYPAHLFGWQFLQNSQADFYLSTLPKNPHRHTVAQYDCFERDEKRSFCNRGSFLFS